MSNVDFICTAQKIVLCNREIPEEFLGSEFFIINTTEGDALKYIAGDDEEDIHRYMVFIDEEDAKKVLEYSKKDMNDIPLYLTTIMVNDKNRDTCSMYIDHNKINCNPFIKEVINSINNNPDYGHMLETDELFYAMITELVTHIFDADYVTAADSIMNIMYSFVTVYKQVLSTVSHIANTEAIDEAAIKKMEEMMIGESEDDN